MKPYPIEHCTACTYLIECRQLNIGCLEKFEEWATDDFSDAGEELAPVFPIATLTPKEIKMNTTPIRMDNNDVVAQQLRQVLPETVTQPVFNRAIALMRAIEDNRVVEYIYDSPNTPGITHWNVKPSHMYAYQDGTVYVKAWSSKFNAPRTFRLDRMIALHIGREVPMKDVQVVFPAVWRLRKTLATRMKNMSSYLTRGWSVAPVVLVEPIEN
jgi:hypothetical protein